MGSTKAFTDTLRNRLEQLRESMTRLTVANNQTAAKAGGVKSVAWIGDTTDFTKSTSKGRTTSQNINLRRKLSEHTWMDRKCRGCCRNSK